MDGSPVTTAEDTKFGLDYLPLSKPEQKSFSNNNTTLLKIQFLKYLLD